MAYVICMNILACVVLLLYNFTSYLLAQDLDSASLVGIKWSNIALPMVEVSSHPSHNDHTVINYADWGFPVTLYIWRFLSILSSTANFLHSSKIVASRAQSISHAEASKSGSLWEPALLHTVSKCAFVLCSPGFVGTQYYFWRNWP